MYICNNCNITTEDLRTFDEQQPYGEGSSCETMIETECGCGGDFEVAKECELCGEYFAGSQTKGTLCNDCFLIGSTKQNAESFDEKAIITINALYAHLFTSEEINELLKDELMNNNIFNRVIKRRLQKEVECFCRLHEEEFCKHIVELSEKEKNSEVNHFKNH